MEYIKSVVSENKTNLAFHEPEYKLSFTLYEIY